MSLDITKGTLDGEIVDIDGNGTAEAVIIISENNGHDVFVSMRFIKVVITSVIGTVSALVGSYFVFL